MRKTGKMCGKCVIVMIIFAWRHVLLWLLRFAGTKLNTQVEGSRSQRRDLRRLERAARGHLLAGGAACCCNRQHVATKLKYNQQMGEVKRNDFISGSGSSSRSHRRGRSFNNRRRRSWSRHMERHITHTPRVAGTQITLGFVMN